MFVRANCWTTRPFDIYFSFKLFSVPNCISRECSDSNCPSQGLLLRCLATTDLSVGLIAEPLAVASWMSIVNENWNICRFSQTVGLIIVHILTGVSLWALTAISVDRLLALLLVLRYKQVVTLKRTYVLVISFWVVRTVFAAMLLWKSSIAYLCSFVSTSLCLLTSVISYTKIFLYLRHHQNQGQDHVHQPNQAKKTEHRAIQKGCVHCNMAATDAGHLLSTQWYSHGFSS